MLILIVNLKKLKYKILQEKSKTEKLAKIVYLVHSNEIIRRERIKMFNRVQERPLYEK